MAQKRLGSDDADFIIKLGEVGFTNSEIARKLGVTEGAIRYRIKSRASGEPDGRVSKPSELDGFREWIGTWIADYEGSRRRPTLRLLERMLRENHGYRRSYDSLRRYIRNRFPDFHKKGARLRLETPPGKLLLVDWKEDVQAEIGRFTVLPEARGMGVRGHAILTPYGH